MKKFFATIFLLSLLPTILLAQIPEHYYDAARGKKGNALKTALYNIISDCESITYNQLWDAYAKTDADENGYIIDIYSDVPDGTPAYVYSASNDQCGSYNNEGDCYNREHSIPKSWFNGAAPMYSDIFHLYPTDGWVNNKRGNLAYGEVGTATYTSSNGSKVGHNTFPGAPTNVNVFEPIDAYKGDLARTYFFMSLRYPNVNFGQEANSMFSDSELTTWAMNMMKKWHKQDTVSQKEIDRNNVIFNEIQHNRNPFIDYPELVEFIWGDSINVAWRPFAADTTEPVDPIDPIEPIEPTSIHEMMMQQHQIFPNPAQEEVAISNPQKNINKIDIFDEMGKFVNGIIAPKEEVIYLNIKHLQSGIYFIKITEPAQVETHKLLIF